MVKRFRILAVVIFVIASLILSTSCSSVLSKWQKYLPGQKTAGDQPSDSSSLTIYQLIQKIAEAIRNSSNVNATFNSIPSRQLNGLTLDQFQQYINFLRRGISGEISSFSQMNETEIAAVREKLLGRLPDQLALASELQGFWIYFQETGRSEKRFALYIQQQPGQEAYLSSEWISRILTLSDLATLYFDSIDKNDPVALAVLLQTGNLPAETLDKKAKRIINFYQNNITDRTVDFQVNYARIDGIGFEEFGITNPDQTQSVSRSIELQALPNNLFRINDIIPDVLDPADLQVLYFGKPLLEFVKTKDGEPVQIRSGNLESIIGSPLKHDETNCQESASGNSLIDLMYQSLDIKIEGTCFRHSRWNGQILRLNLHGTVCSLESGLRPGMPVQDILKHYPFAADTGYIVKGKFADGTVRLQFHIDEDQVKSLELTWLGG